MHLNSGECVHGPRIRRRFLRGFSCKQPLQALMTKRVSVVSFLRSLTRVELFQTLSHRRLDGPCHQRDRFIFR